MLNLLSHVLLATANPHGFASAFPILYRATDALTAEQITAEETEHRVRNVLALGRTLPPRTLLNERGVVLGKADKLEDARVAQHC